MSRKYIDCRDFPSESGCTVAISADSEDELVEAAAHHVPKHLTKRVGIQLRVPGADRLIVVAQHADELHRQRMRLARFGCDIGARRSSRGRYLQRREVGRVAGPEWRFGDVQRERGRVAAEARILVTHGVA